VVTVGRIVVFDTTVVSGEAGTVEVVTVSPSLPEQAARKIGSSDPSVGA
jgi:hypothetical protein